jgi:phthalate 4,5-dioxygenase oxygenase subunit
MLSPEDNELLTRVEGNAPMGQLMRRHWAPLCMSEEVQEADGTPVRARLFGEDLVVFRDTNGKLGVLAERCPHRRASLALGRNEECGLRCLYHGWKFDVEGNVIEMTSEPAESNFVSKVKHKAYPVREAGGFVWTYMGPPELMPEFERPAFMPSQDTVVRIVKIHVKANWAQVQEGSLDSAHVWTLHSSDIKIAPRKENAKPTDNTWNRPSTDRAPRYQWERTDFGFHYAALRRPIQSGATHEYLRVTSYVAPFVTLVPPRPTYNMGTIVGPTDDHNTAFYFIAWDGPGRPGVDLATWRETNVAVPGRDLDENFNNLRNCENNYLQDRKAMKLGDFTGIKGISNQDIAMWETMGSISDRSQETVGASDFAVVVFRQIMVEAAKRVRDGLSELETPRKTAYCDIRSFEGVVPKTVDWRALCVGKPQSTPSPQVA